MNQSNRAAVQNGSDRYRARGRKGIGLPVFFLSLWSSINVVHAVDAPKDEPSSPSSKSAALDEVVVSATKRGDQDLQTTPLTITAFSSETLQKNGIANISDLAFYTAGLDIQKQSVGQTQVIIRGVVGSAYLAPSSMYLNDVSFEQNGQNPDPDLFDLERVEVLKGPQGTLFGSSAMAGAIRYVTKRPEFNAFSGQLVVDAEATRHGDASYISKGVINVPLVDDTLAMRVMAYRNDNGGWVDNGLTGRKDINTDREVGVRVSTLWQASEALSTHLMLQYHKMNVGHRAAAQQGDSSIWGPGPQRTDEFTTFMLGEDSWSDRFLLSTLEVDWALGDDTTLTSLSGFVDRSYKNARPGDMQEFMLNLFGIDLPNPVFTDPYTSDKISQEFRIVTRFSTFADLTAGAYFSDGQVTYNSLMSEEGWDQFLTDVFLDDTDYGCLPEITDGFFCGTKRVDERQLSVYSQFDFHLSERLTLTTGARWFKYNQAFAQRYAGYWNNGPSEKTQKFDEDGINPKFGLSYSPADDMLVFLSAAKGFRMGGVDDPIPSTCNAELPPNYDGAFKSDSLWSYELGAKSTLFNNRVTVNGAVFDTEWDNIQTGTALDCAYLITQNASKQRIRGVELATRFAVTGNLSIGLNGNYTDARLVGDSSAGPDGAPGLDIPRFTINGTLDYERAVTSSLRGFALLSFSHRADYPVQYNNVVPQIPAQSVANLRFGLQSERYKVSLYVKNLTDELLLTGVSNGRGGELDWRTGRPRTIGLELQADF